MKEWTDIQPVKDHDPEHGEFQVTRGMALTHAVYEFTRNFGVTEFHVKIERQHDQWTTLITFEDE